MHIFKEIEPLKAFLNQKRAQQNAIGLVPTMGALHAGHIRLIAASKTENQTTVCSIYVNPTQFNNPSDLQNYPRTLETDIALLEQEKCDVLFCPDNLAMYPRPSTLQFDFGRLDKVLEGEFRPGHFSGVAMVVSKLFNIVQPDRAYFGQKDFQQFKIISKLVDELKFDLDLRCVPTVRESNGLAMSSRNKRLSEQDRSRALVFFNALTLAREEIKKNIELRDVKEHVRTFCDTVDGVRLEYFEAADRENLILLDSVKEPDRSVLLIAGFVGSVRLIDNMMID